MSRRAQLVSQMVEEALARRVAAPFAPATRVLERTPFGIDAIDAVAHGGAPLGAITELAGAACSGRTTVALSLVSRFTAEAGVCAWVDVADAFSPESAAASGVDLSRLLWIRCGAESARQPLISPHSALAIPGAATLTAAEVGVSSAGLMGGNSPHPRSEGRHMPQAIQAMLVQHGGLLDHQVRREQRSIGTPGAPNRPLTPGAASASREEQIATDRLPARRGEAVVVATRCAEPQPRRGLNVTSGQHKLPLPGGRMQESHYGPVKPWQELDQALRATDLLLANGGFAAIVLDLGSTPAEFAWRIPMATWFRYRAACERSRTSLVLLTQHACAKSSAGLVLRLQPGTMEAVGPLMTGVRFQAMSERIRFGEQPPRVVPIRKPPQPQRAGRWTSEAVWR